MAATPRESARVKLIVAIIQPSHLQSVKDALSEVEVFRLTVSDVQGFGQQKGRTQVYPGQDYAMDLLRKISQRINRKVSDLAVEVVRTGALREFGPSAAPTRR